MHGFAIAGTPTIDADDRRVQGNDLTVTAPAGAVPAGTPVTVTSTTRRRHGRGQTYLGELLLGPPSAPTAITVPVEVTKTAGP